MNDSRQHRFVLTSRWHLDCPIEAAWQRIGAIHRWPAWWPNVRAVHSSQPPCADKYDTPRVGSSAYVNWKTILGYGLQLRVTTTRVAAPYELEGTAEGDLSGCGLWLLDPLGFGVVVTYRWDVHLNRRWMRATAPLLRPVFAWNHFAVMQAGARAMARDIGCRLLAYRDYRACADGTPGEMRDPLWPVPQPSSRAAGVASLPNSEPAIVKNQ